MERHPVCMLLLQAILHCRFGQVLLGGFRGLEHGDHVCYVFLKSTVFAMKLALMLLEPSLHCFIAGGAGNCRWWSGQLLLQNFFREFLFPWLARTGQRSSGCSELLLASSQELKQFQLPAAFLRAFASSALQGSGISTPQVQGRGT